MTATDGNKPKVAFGPEMPGWGSWEWVGSDIAAELSSCCRIVLFAREPPPDCDAAVIVKHPPPAGAAERIVDKTRIIFCPVDFYGSAAEIDRDGAFLRLCSRILVHSESLRKYFEPYAPVEYMDHHVKYVSAKPPTQPKEVGPLLWVGVRTNLPYLTDWVRAHPLPAELLVLSNFEQPVPPRPAELGFPDDRQCVLRMWSPQAHRQALSVARGALDVKGTDFRQRHKPPTKAFDYVASGLPTAVNADSAVTEHFARMGFQLADPTDPERWLSHDYWRETQSFGAAFRELYTIRRIGLRYRGVLERVLADRDRR